MQAINAQVDEYYVGEDGKRVTESWISVENEDYGNDESEPEYYWYYYGKTENDHIPLDDHRGKHLLLQ